MNLSLDSLKDQVSNLSLYDIKAGVRKVQNAVMNYTEMEAKVREATNNEPWGASSSLMQEIANATYNYQLLNEIMPMIYKRFTEKAAEEWRQIYKGLQLLEFLIKNGSERVVDDARSHLSLLKMLRQFHFIDQNGKDQGLNVRNRAKELAELLGDVERIRGSAKRHEQREQKYTGVEGGAGLGGSSSMSSGSRYGGFGSEEQADYGGYSGGVYGDGGGFGGQQASDFQDTGAGSRGASKFDEYDEYDEGAVAAPGRRQADAASSSRSSRRTEPAAKKPEAPKKKEPEVDLFSFDEPAPSNIPSVLGGDEEDDFDDFQSAPPAPAATQQSFISPPQAPNQTSTTTSYTQFAAPQPVSAPKAADLSSLVGFNSISPTPSNTATPINYSAFSPPTTAQSKAPKPVAYQGSQPNYFTSVKAPSSNTSSTIASPAAKAAATKSSGGDAFGSIWNTASVGIKKSSTPTQGPALGQLAKEKASAGIWGAPAPASTYNTQQQQKPQSSASGLGGGLDDLLG